MVLRFMPRKSRIIVPDCPHHIIQRGHNRQVVFAADGDYQSLNPFRSGKRN
jgi:REP element-mobilizing transposase RayT